MPDVMHVSRCKREWWPWFMGSGLIAVFLVAAGSSHTLCWNLGCSLVDHQLFLMGMESKGEPTHKEVRAALLDLVRNDRHKNKDLPDSLTTIEQIVTLECGELQRLDDKTLVIGTWRYDEDNHTATNGEYYRYWVHIYCVV